MRNDKVHHFISTALVLILVAGGSAGAQEDYLTVEKSDWRVAVAVLDTGDVDGTILRSTASLVPRLLFDGLDGADMHRLTDEERKYLAEELVEDRWSTTRDSLARLHDQRDRMFFDPNADPEDMEFREESILELKRELSALENWSDDHIVVPETLPVIFTDGGNGGDFVPSVTGDPQLMLENSDLDMLIHGNIVRVGDYFGLKILATVPGRSDVLWEGAVDEDGVEEAADEAVRRGLELVLGRPWSSVNIQVAPEDAAITIDGSIVGVGYWAESTLEPGFVTMEVTATGHTPQVQVIELPVNGTLNMELALEPTDHPSVLVSSEPAGADVRLGSIWLGITPLAIPLPDRVMSLHFEKEGYRNQTVPFYPDSPAFTVPLGSRIVDPAEEMATAQKKLHTAMALFSFSLAPTIILIGVSQNYAYMNLTATDPDDIARSYNAYQATYWSMWGSVALNGALLTNVFFKLARYLKAAEGLNE